MNIVMLKSILLVVMAIVTWTFGLSPIKVMSFFTDGNSQLSHRASLMISLISCFAGGVFLSVCFLDMMPDSLEAWENIRKEKGISTDYPMVPLIFCLGFFFVYIFEELSGRMCGHGKPKENKLINSITFVTAFLFHAGLEGFAFGVQDSVGAVSTLFFGIIVHKAIVSFSIGMRLVREHPDKPWLIVVLISIIALIAPLGGAIGIVVEDSAQNSVTKDILTAVLMSIALGTFIYITFFDILAPEHSNKHDNIAQWIATFLGFALIAGVMVVSG